VNRRTWWLIGLGAVLAVVASAWVTTRNQAYPGYLDPQNPDRGGAQAVARVLADQGVQVEIVRGRQDFDDAAVGVDTVVLVTSADDLGRSTVADLRRHAGAASIVVVEPGPLVMDQLDVGIGPLGVEVADPVRAGCDDFDGLTIEVDFGTAYRPGRDSCFLVEAGSLLTSPAPGLTLLGAGSILDNHQILHGDNAAVALRLLGAKRHLVWYVPSTTDLAAGDEVTLGSLLPPWIEPGLWLVIITVLGAIAWRARRLGRLATEPLPVTVKAIEAAQSRGRLYRKANDRAHAALALRQAARVGIVERLRLPHDAPLDVVVSAVEAASGRDARELRDLLYGAPPAGDRDLIQLATTLAELEHQLRKAPR